MAAENRTTGRRRMLQGALALAALPQAASALDDMPADLASARPTSQIDLQIAAVVDNGAAVPVTVSSHLPGTLEMIIVVEGNPQPVAGRFVIPAGTEPWVATRIKMAGSSTVFALARTADGLFAAARPVQVTVGGCG